MVLKYKTSKLPPNFLILGILLIIIGIWRIVVSDWIGIILLVVSFFCLFTEFGIEIDSQSKKLKKYVGVFIFRVGKWKDIGTVSHLIIARVKQTQSMNVLSINRIESDIAYKLVLILPTEKIDLASGKKEFVYDMGNKIADSLQISIKTLNS